MKNQLAQINADVIRNAEQRDTARRGVLTHDGKRDAMSPLYEELNRYYTRNYTDAQFEAILAHAERLAEALRRIAFEPQGKSDASHAEVLRAVENIAREALAAWEGAQK